MGIRSKMVAVSTHALAQAFLAIPDAPARTRIVGPLTIIWEGKPGDVMTTISTDEFFGWDEQHATDVETIRAHLKRGTDSTNTPCMWGGLEWAIYRLTGIDPDALPASSTGSTE